MEIKVIESPINKRTPYSLAIRADKLIFVSGQVGIENPKTGTNNNDTRSQCRQCIENMKSVLESAGSNLSDVVKVNVFLKLPDDMSVMNEVFTEYFPNSPPARSTIIADLVLPNMLVEIDCIACAKV